LFDGIDDGICYAFDLSTIITLGSSYNTCALYSFINFIMLFRMLSWKALEFTLSHDETVKKKRSAFEISPSTSVDFF